VPLGIGSATVHDDTSTQAEIRALVAELADAKITPHVGAWHADHHVPVEVLGELGRLGILGTIVPEEHGGAGLGASELAVVVEELARRDAGIAVAVAVHAGLLPGALGRWGSDAQCAATLPGVASGETFAAYCLTEPDCGSDVGAVRTELRAVAGGGRSLHGTKTWITNGRIADVMVVFARDTDHGGVDAVVAVAGEGLERGPEIPKLGLHTSSTCELTFDGLVVDAGARLGGEGDGVKVALSTLDAGRISIAAQSCGIARAALDVAVEYAVERPAFGGPIARFQGVQFPLADVAAELDAARLVTYRAAALRDAGRPHGVEGAKAKLLASAVAVKAADVAVQTLGGYGYAEEYPAARLYRDARVTQLYEGTSEIQRLVIARDLLGPASRG
jgi:alkylation response protein AidB-like acyl-CoA dehydrogenase